MQYINAEYTGAITNNRAFQLKVGDKFRLLESGPAFRVMRISGGRIYYAYKDERGGSNGYLQYIGARSQQIIVKLNK